MIVKKLFYCKASYPISYFFYFSHYKMSAYIPGFICTQTQPVCKCIYLV